MAVAAADGRAVPARAQSGPGGADFDASALLDLAEETGARAEVLKGLDRDRGNVDRLKDAVESIAMTLRHRYLVGYDPATGKQGWRKIKVDVVRPRGHAPARARATTRKARPQRLVLTSVHSRS